VAWEIFEKAASRYEAWYTTPRGQRTDWAERKLLEWLLRQFPTARSILEVGCGTGHFASWIASQGLKVIGLDRAPAMIAELHRLTPTLPVILGDAHQLPFRNHAVDVIAFITTLEFLDHVELAVSEALRVARQGVLLIVLNRWSVGGLSRRFGSQRRESLLGQAQDYSVETLRRLIRQGGGKYIRSLTWRCTLFPVGFWSLQAPIPFGDVIGMAVGLSTA
jgi:ubiquinone/menaquinone biosynthesis C-methylase UbiE